MVKTFEEHVLTLVENFCSRIVFSTPTCLILETPSYRQAALAMRALYVEGFKATWMPQNEGTAINLRIPANT